MVLTDVPQYDNLLGKETQKIIIISRILSSTFNKLKKNHVQPYRVLLHNVELEINNNNKNLAVTACPGQAYWFG